MKKSNLYTLHMQDVVKGLITAAGTAALVVLQQSVEAGHLPANWQEWQPVAMAAVGGGIAYLLKNFLTNSNDKFLKKERK